MHPRQLVNTSARDKTLRMCRLSEGIPHSAPLKCSATLPHRALWLRGHPLIFKTAGVESHRHSCLLCCVSSSLPTMQEVKAESMKADNKGYTTSPPPHLRVIPIICGFSRSLRQLCTYGHNFRPRTLALTGLHFAMTWAPLAM